MCKIDISVLNVQDQEVIAEDPHDNIPKDKSKFDQIEALENDDHNYVNDQQQNYEENDFVEDHTYNYDDHGTLQDEEAEKDNPVEYLEVSSTPNFPPLSTSIVSKLY